MFTSLRCKFHFNAIHVRAHDLSKKYKPRHFSVKTKHQLDVFHRETFNTEYLWHHFIYTIGVNFGSDISSTDISKYPLRSKNIFGHIFIFNSAPFIPNYIYLKVNFLGPENLVWDISTLGWASTLRYRGWL